VAGGIAAVTIAGVARESGASRPTVYRHFRDRAELLEATLYKVADSARADSEFDYANFSTLQERVIAAVLYSIKANLEDPVLRILWESPELSRDIIAMYTAEKTLKIVRTRFEPIISIGHWREDEIMEVLETFQRFALTLIVAPGPERTQEELIRYIVRRLFPAIGVPPLEGSSTIDPALDLSSLTIE
jgi:AcrR family transcriptional regulator